MNTLTPLGVAERQLTRSPLLLEIMTHYYASAGEFPRHPAPACLGMIENLVRAEMLEETDNPLNLSPSNRAHWRITDKGRAWVVALLRVPFPTSRVVWEVTVSDRDGDHEITL